MRRDTAFIRSACGIVSQEPDTSAATPSVWPVLSSEWTWRTASNALRLGRYAGRRPPAHRRDTPWHPTHSSDTWAIPSLWRATAPAVSDPSGEWGGACQSHGAHAALAVDLALPPWARPAFPGVLTPPGLSAAPDSRAGSSRSSRGGARTLTAGVSRVAWPCLVHACHRQYPGGTARGVSLVLLDRRRPALSCRQVGARMTRFTACSAFTRGMAYGRAASPERSLFQACCSPRRYLRKPLLVLPAGATSCWADSHPLESTRLSRHTEESGTR
jgi:hypothetical protein